MLKATARALSLMAILGVLSARAAAAPQAPDVLPSQSLDRVKAALDKTPPRSLRFDVKLPTPIVTFKTTTTERVYMLPFVEQLRKDFELSPLQRQSSEWASKCCGLNLLGLSKSLKKAWHGREEHKAREQVARELADVRAAAKK